MNEFGSWATAPNLGLILYSKYGYQTRVYCTPTDALRWGVQCMPRGLEAQFHADIRTITHCQDLNTIGRLGPALLTYLHLADAVYFRSHVYFTVHRVS